MTLAELRRRHPRLVYEKFEVKELPETYLVTFRFLLEPDIRLRPTIEFPKSAPLGPSLNQLIFNVGLVEAISYWKLACPAVLLVKAGKLTAEQIAWWQKLFINGLGEFYFNHNIDFTQPDFFTIRNGRGAPSLTQPSTTTQPSGDLVLVGGGKDSAVTLELTNRIPYRRNALMLNPTPAALAVVKVARYDSPYIIKRTIDPTLLRLNTQGYLNGHTPFSAYLAFLALFLATYYGYRQVIASNELSASEGNVLFHGAKVNHQYSKSYQFERDFRNYSRAYLSDTTSYFSFLRPLADIQIAQLFSRQPKFFPVFNSCNVGGGTKWCGRCPKCAFTYLVLRPFLTQKQMLQIFGNDLLTKPAIISYLYKLVGLEGHKPFECVGTRDESRLALGLAIEKYQKERLAIPDQITKIARNLKLTAQALDGLKASLAPNWTQNNCVPIDYLQLLRHHGESLWQTL